jgi:hypothetical protein
MFLQRENIYGGEADVFNERAYFVVVKPIF